MKKLFLTLVVISCLFTAYAILSFKADPVVKRTVVKSASKVKKQVDYTFTLTANGTARDQYYRIQFSGSNFNGTFPFTGGSGTATVPAGTYTVGIFPASSPTTHTFSGTSCATSYSGSGTSIIFNNVLVCSAGSFTIN